MTNTKHTPGPWTWTRNEYPINITGKDGKYVCQGLYPSQEADARLIAAAPDLYAFAQEFLRVWAGPGETDSPLEAQARAALAKVDA